MDSFIKFWRSLNNASLCKHIWFSPPLVLMTRYPVVILWKQNITLLFLLWIDMAGLCFQEVVCFLHWLMCKPLQWQYMVTLNCCLSLLQKPNDTFTHKNSILWKGGHNNTIKSDSKQKIMSWWWWNWTESGLHWILFLIKTIRGQRLPLRSEF